MTENQDITKTVTVRNYRSNDLDACRGLWVELTEWHRRIYQSPEIGGPDPRRHFDAHLEKVGPNNIWVAEVGGKVVGMAGVIPGRSEGWGEREAELEPLVVSGPYRRKGIARQLTRAVIDTARSRGLRYVTVRPTARNELALRFFHNEGFDILGQIELIADLRPTDQQGWKTGEKIAGKQFRA